jgi:hypothetical protein
LAFKNTSFKIGLNCKKELKRNVNDSFHLLSLISLVKQAATGFPVDLPAFPNNNYTPSDT